MSGYQHLDQGRQRAAITLGCFLGSLLEFRIQPQTEMGRFARMCHTTLTLHYNK